MHAHTCTRTHLNHSKIWLIGQTNQPFQVPQMAQGITWSNVNVPSLKIHPSLHSVWSHSSNDPGLLMDPSAKYWASVVYCSIKMQNEQFQGCPQIWFGDFIQMFRLRKINLQRNAGNGKWADWYSADPDVRLVTCKSSLAREETSVRSPPLNMNTSNV